MPNDDQSNLSEVKPLTEERARKWLKRSIWARGEATLILAGHDPESPMFYDADGASGMTTAFNLHHALPSADCLPPAEYIAWAGKRHPHGQTTYRRLELPSALRAALEPATTDEKALMRAAARPEPRVERESVIAMPTKQGVIELPAGTKHVRFEELPHLIASALVPIDESSSDGHVWHFSEAEVMLQGELNAAVESGELPAKNPRTFGPYMPNGGVRLADCVVLVQDLRQYVAKRGLSVEFPETEAEHETERAPVVATIVHSTLDKRRDMVWPAIELAQGMCRNPDDVAEVWAQMQVLAKKQTPPFIGATEDGLQYLKAGDVALFKRDTLRKRLTR